MKFETYLRTVSIVR